MLYFLSKLLTNYFTVKHWYHDKMPCMFMERVSYEYAAVAMTLNSQSRIGGVIETLGSDLKYWNYLYKISWSKILQWVALCLSSWLNFCSSRLESLMSWLICRWVDLVVQAEAIGFLFITNKLTRVQSESTQFCRQNIV